jgi:hypothetical protein
VAGVDQPPPFIASTVGDLMVFPVLGAIVDESVEVIDTFIAAMRAAFNPFDAVQPPLGGGSETVRFIAGDVAPMELWDAHAAGCDCREPFLWVRMTQRFRTRDFPNPATEPEACELPRVIGIELGIGRCAALQPTVDWREIEREAQISLDDSWRMEMALCHAVARCKHQDRLIATRAVVPHGPQGGVIGWAATAFVKL